MIPCYHPFLIFFSIKDIQTKFQLGVSGLRCLVVLIRASQSSGWTRRLVIRSNSSAVIQCKWTAARFLPVPSSSGKCWLAVIWPRLFVKRLQISPATWAPHRLNRAGQLMLENVVVCVWRECVVSFLTLLDIFWRCRKRWVCKIKWEYNDLVFYLNQILSSIASALAYLFLLIF